MKMLALLSLTFGLAFGITGCGGGSGSVAPPVGAAPSPASTTAASSSSIALSGQASSYPFPAAGEFSGTVALPGSDAAAAATMTMESSTTSPAGVAPGTVDAQLPQAHSAGSATLYFFLTFTTSVTVTFHTLPGFSIQLPASIHTSGQQFFYGVADASTLPYVFRTQGPGTIDGSTITFAASGTPLTLKKRTPYLFVFYSSSTPTTVPTTAPTTAPTGIPSTISGIVSGLDPTVGGFDTCDTPPIYPNFGCIPVSTFGATVTGTLVIGGSFVADGYGFPTVPKFDATAITYYPRPVPSPTPSPSPSPSPSPVPTASAIVNIQGHR